MAKNVYLSAFFLKILALCMVSIQEWFLNIFDWYISKVLIWLKPTPEQLKRNIFINREWLIANYLVEDSGPREFYITCSH